MTTTQRYIPAHYTIQKEVGGAIVYVGEREGRFTAIGWRSAKQINHDFHHYFNTQQARDAFLTAWWDRHERIAQEEQDRKTKKKELREQPVPFKVGEILYNSWGYEQTTIDFYQVVEVEKRSVVLRKIQKETVKEGGFMSRYVVARKDEWAGEPFMKVVNFLGDGQATCSMDHGILSPWDGKSLLQTEYA